MLHLYQDTPIGGGDALYAMTDVNINNPEDGQMLVYDASTQRWRNVTQKSLNDLAEVTDLTNVIATGSTNATGATIPKGLYFYLNDELCQAKSDIASGATFTLNTNYEVVTAGGLNSLNSAIAELSRHIKIKIGNVTTNISSGIANLRTDGKPIIYVTSGIDGWYYSLGRSRNTVWAKCFNYDGTVVADMTNIAFYYYYLDNIT